MDRAVFPRKYKNTVAAIIRQCFKHGDIINVTGRPTSIIALSNHFRKSRVKPWLRMLEETHVATRKTYHSGAVFAGANAPPCTNALRIADTHRT